MDWRCASSGRAPALQAQSPEFNTTQIKEVRNGKGFLALEVVVGKKREKLSAEHSEMLAYLFQIQSLYLLVSFIIMTHNSHYITRTENRVRYRWMRELAKEGSKHLQINEGSNLKFKNILYCYVV
jgi:hypothetical protein